MNEQPKPTRTAALEAVRTILSYVGEDPNRPGLLETPERVIKAYEEDWCRGYKQDPAEILKAFEDGGEKYDGMLFIGGIPVTSNCEHHICGIIGEAHFGYLPDKRIVGLSKIPRLIDVFAKRLQVQERLTSQVVDAFVEHVQCHGCGLTMKLRHLCMESRGVRLSNTITTTTTLRGIFLTDPDVKAEFLSRVRDEKK